MNINPLKAPEHEASIMEHWKYTDKVYISCVCITYNQENYIKDAIDGMLAQITDYRFEIVIHDDKSTDSTREILLEYKRKYPNLIKLVLQDENQYQKGKKITPLAIAEAIGEYIALCEGDDYWIDELKIQKQVNCLENNKNINICFTSAKMIDSKKQISSMSLYEKTFFTLIEVVEGGGAFMPTCSIMFRVSSILTLPKWYIDAPVGDYFMQMYISQNGALYLKNPSCCYRANAIGSWSSRQIKRTSDDIIHNQKKMETNLLLAFESLNIPNTIQRKILAKNLLYWSVLAFKSKFHKLSRKYIKKSWSYKKNINYKQTILYIYFILK